MYQNGYLHGSPSRFSAKSAIYTAAGCQHEIAIYTAAVPEPIQVYTRLRIYTRLPGGSSCIKMVIYTAALQDSQPNRLYTRLPGVNMKFIFTRPPFQSLFRLAMCQHKIAIYTAAI